MKRHASSRFFGSCVIAGILLSVIMGATIDLLRPEYSPLRNLLGEYLVGPFSFLGRAAACMVAATFLMLLVGFRLSIRPSGFLTASCVLMGVVVSSLCVSALFPIDVWPPAGSRPNLTGAGIIQLVSAVRFPALLIALLLTLPSAYKRDANWRPLSRVTLLLGLLILAFAIGCMLAPFDLRGLVQRGVALVILVWWLLAGWRLRQAIPSAQGTAA